jgi:UDP-2-acetamido-2,6-beta-L-arabino-hexul-4-ose reductase
MRHNNKTILITGSNGFIGRNLTIKLKEKNFKIKFFNKNHNIDLLYKLIPKVDFIIHLAAINRSKKKKRFYKYQY